MFACDLEPAGAKLKFSKSGRVERIGSQAITGGDRPDLFEPAFGTLTLRDSDGAI